MSVNGLEALNPQIPLYSRHGVTFAKAGDDAVQPGSRWPTVDTVDISNFYTEAMANADAMKRAIQQRYDKISYTHEDLAPLKERFAELQKSQRDINSKIQQIISASGVTLGFGDQLKVEIDSSGKAIVGGLADLKTTKRLQQAINSDQELVNEIAAYQEMEEEISLDLKAVTGMSLRHYKERVVYFQRGGLPDSLPLDGKVYSKHDLVGLRDQDLFLIDEEFTGMISGHFAQGPVVADFSGFNSILEDATATVDGAVRDVMVKISDAFDRFNEEIIRNFSDGMGEIKDFLISLSGLTITVDSDREVTIEGDASRDARNDQTAKKMITRIFERELQPNPETGQKTDFTVAAEYLLLQYQDNFSLPDSDAKLETVFQGWNFETHASSQETEERLRDEIAGEARAALSGMGVANAGQLDLIVTDEGKIAVSNLSESAPDYEVIQTALKMLNGLIEDRSFHDFDAIELATDPADRLKGLMAQLDVFLPNGASKLSNDWKY